MTISLATQNRLPNGVKSPDDGGTRPFSINQRILDVEHYRLDLDSIFGVDDGKRMIFEALCELKEVIADLRGFPVDDKPHQEAFWLNLARVLNARFLKAADQARIGPTRPAAFEYDTISGRIQRTFLVHDQWRAQLLRAASTKLAGEPFSRFYKGRGFLQYTCDDRTGDQLGARIRNFAVPAIVLETIGALDSAEHRHDLRVFTQLAQQLAATQCLAPLVLDAHAYTKFGPWQLRVTDPVTLRVLAIYDLPILPERPWLHLGDPGVHVWQHVWNVELQMRERYRVLRDQAKHRSHKEDGQSYCRNCITGQCNPSDTKSHKLAP